MFETHQQREKKIRNQLAFEALYLSQDDQLLLIEQLITNLKWKNECCPLPTIKRETRTRINKRIYKHINIEEIFEEFPNDFKDIFERWTANKEQVE